MGLLLLALLAQQAAASAPAPARAQPPRLINREIVVFSDYPASALRNEESGIVSILVTVGPDGRAERCEVTETSRSAGLDEATCRLARLRARFEPARNAAGEAVEGVYRSVIGWGIGGPVPGTLLSMDVAVQALPRGYQRPASLKATFDASGRMVACEVDKTSGSAAADAVACRQAVGMTIPPPKAPRGVAAAAVRMIVARFSPAPAR